MHYLNLLFNLSRSSKKWLLLAHDIFMLSVAFWSSFLLRLDFKTTLETPNITIIYPLVLLPTL
ncbi:MAG: hypothetical protein IJ881_04610, partial [Neisseriaceae bacterium]|nr:hypothetical protein [Neisseriaceae bacterium]